MLANHPPETINMPMLTTAIEAFPSLVTRSNSVDGEHDFGEKEEERRAFDFEEQGQKMMEVHQNTMSSLETALSSLSVSNKPIITANDSLLSEVIAQWDALSHREKDAAYFSTYSGSLDFVGRRLVEISSFYYAVIDGKNLDRRIVSIALSYLKSFLTRQAEESNKGFYQLAMLTSLYVAIKTHSSNIYHDGRPMVFIREVVNWSDGVFTTKDITEMETRMLSTLDYHMNPPVPQHFLDIITPMLDADLIIIPLVKQHIITISNWLCDISATDSYFTSVKPSSVAYAAILVAVDTSSAGALKCFESLCLKNDEYITLQCYERMVEMYYQLGELPYENSDRCCSPAEVFFPLGSTNY